MKRIIGMGIVLMLVIGLSGCTEYKSAKVVTGIIIYQAFNKDDDETILIFEGDSQLYLVGEHDFILGREITIMCEKDSPMNYRYSLIEYEYD